MRGLSLEYSPLEREMLRKAALVRQPVNGTFELTSRCNLSCRMCYIRNSASDIQRRKRELPASAWLELALQAKDNGLVFLLLTGGEVFLRPDFFEICEPLTRMGLILTLFTNGTLVTKAIAERLALAPPNRTEITLYGATIATYEAVTGVSGSYAACCAGIEALIACSIPLGLKCTVTRNNAGELESMRQMAHNWGVPFSASWLLSKRPDGAPSDVERYRLSAHDCVALEANDQASAHEWNEAALRELTTNDDQNFYCKAGKAAFVINPLGEMNACIDLPLPAVHPLETGFALAWEQMGRFVDSVPPRSPVCHSCDLRVFCGRCPAWSLMETGTLTEPVQYLCDIARQRKYRYAQLI